MMLGERSYGHVRPWSSAADDGYIGGGDDYSQLFSLQALQRYLPSNADEGILEFPDSEGGVGGGDGDLLPVDAHTCDHFRMFEFKVRKCTRGRSHDWTECAFAHPGEKARRRDPRKYHYSGAACQDFRKGGGCWKGDACEFAHGVFECWLHPARYRTQPCKDGMACRRRVCFFAHSPDQLRVLSPRGAATDSSLSRLVIAEPASPTAADSPPMSPITCNGSVNEIVASLRQMQLKSALSSSLLGDVGGCASPRLKISPTGYYSLPTTPTRAVARPGIGYFDEEIEEPIMERVESGRDLRAKMFEKLSKENPLDRADPDPDPNPDVGWVSELIK